MKDLLREDETYTFLNKRTGDFETYNIHTGELLASNGVFLAKNNFAYTLELSDAIASLVREGSTFKQICAMDGMPSLHTLYVWKRLHPDFDKKLSEARKDRADRYYERAVESLEDKDLATKDDVPLAKFRFDGYMKLAEKGNPLEFGQTTKVVGDVNAPLQIIVQTGILRESVEPITVENTYEEVSDTVEQQRCDRDGREGVPVVSEESEGAQDGAGEGIAGGESSDGGGEGCQSYREKSQQEET